MACILAASQGHTVPGHSPIPSTNAYKCKKLRPKLPAKRPQKSAKRPQKPANARKSKNLVNLYNFGSAQLNRNQLGCADRKQNTGEKTGRRAMPMGNTAMTYHA